MPAARHSGLIPAMRYIRDHHQAQAVCQECGRWCRLPDSFYDDGADQPCEPCPTCQEHALVLVDATTAHAVMTVYEALNGANKAKMAAMPLVRMVEVAWKLADLVK